ncbi:MAG TPA: M48 family metalloprotease [Ignavibacteria bacterium]|nr:M48 family metalloprotease [Ignavibacteria bacterium]HAX48958.1 peptidase M48 Ste24p [Bacteroidota bacterium]HRE09327.1 M48 family metalloprotease [Ignavibacteria bacterium]HRF66286.1 M48 family metalloprotease [Ignavibacteria bacterium]HRJ05087.1 M48 family metalloprotease [Ignavibacteria bacterium]
MNYKARIFIGVVIALIAVVSYYMKTDENPVTGEKQKVSLTVKEEIALGLQSAPEMIAEFGGEYRDKKLQAYVDRVGNKLVQSTEAGSSPYRFEFHLLADENTVNAFALPGGQIFITYALLKRLKNEDQLAGVLGHEIGHVINRHSAEHIAKQELTQGLIEATDIASGDPGMISRFVGNMVNMKYGRDDELESDDYGVKYMIQAGYKPEAMIEVMRILKEASGGGNQPEFMSTHPSADNRIEKLKEVIAKYKKR